LSKESLNFINFSEPSFGGQGGHKLALEPSFGGQGG